MYGSPFTVVPEYPWGTPVRSAIVDAYQHAQRLLCITGICLCVTLIVFSLVLRDYRLTNTQSRPDAERPAGAESPTESLEAAPREKL